MKILSLIIYVTFASLAIGQIEQESNIRLRADFQYLNFNYEEPGVMTEKGQFPGVRGELIWWLSGSWGLSGGGRYFSGHLNYDGSTFGGTPIQVITEDYVSEYFGLIHLRFVQAELSFGYARREWFNDLVISYTRRTTYVYYPISITYKNGPFYYRGEYRIWGEGENTSTMSRVNPSANDVTFTQDSGSGFAIEIGVQRPFGTSMAKVYVAYDYWSVEDSDVQNDGTQNLIEPKNNTQTYIFGVGFIF